MNTLSANPSWPALPSIQADPPTLVSEPPLSPGNGYTPAQPPVSPEPEPAPPVPLLPEPGPVAEPDYGLPAFSPPEPEPEPFPTIATVSAPEPEAIPPIPVHVAATTFRVSIRMDDGQQVEVASHGDESAARAEATALMRYLRDGRGDWPFVGGRFLRPERIVSIDVDQV